MTRAEVIDRHIQRLMTARDALAAEGARNSTYGRMAFNSLELTLGLLRQYRGEIGRNTMSQGARMAESAK